ncbi:MAG TPA: hypothetical protein VJ861_12815 [Treponemataceae bacterium]|nr:hypothetical protein [Treponemataceae bacterium]
MNGVKRTFGYIIFAAFLFLSHSLSAESSAFFVDISSFSRSDIAQETETKSSDIPLSGGASNFALKAELLASRFSLKFGAGISLISKGIPTVELRESVITTAWQEGVQFRLGRVSAFSVGPDPSGWLSGARSPSSLITPLAPTHSYIDLIQFSLQDNSFFAHIAVLPFAPQFSRSSPEDPLFDWYQIDSEVNSVFSTYTLNVFDYPDEMGQLELNPACYVCTGVAEEMFTVYLFGFAGPDRFPVRSFQYRVAGHLDQFNLSCRQESAVVYGGGILAELFASAWDIQMGGAWTGGRLFSQGKNVNIEGDWTIPVSMDSFDLSARFVQRPFESDFCEISAKLQYLVPINPPNELNLPTFSRISIISASFRPLPIPLWFSIDWTQSLQDGSYILGGTAVVKIPTQGELAFALGIPSGEVKSEFGQYREHSRAFCSLSLKWNVSDLDSF